jgi:hypothetical protein
MMNLKAPSSVKAAGATTTRGGAVSSVTIRASCAARAAIGGQWELL